MGSTTGEALALLHQGVDAVAEVDTAELSDAPALEALRELEVLVNRVAAQRSRPIGCVHRRGACRLDGAASTAAWLRSRLRIGDPARHVRIAAAAARVPEIGEAYERGEISASHHVLVHEGGWSIHFDPRTNTVTATRPDGRPLDMISRPGRPP